MLLFSSFSSHSILQFSAALRVKPTCMSSCTLYTAPSDDVDIFSLRELYLQPIYHISPQQLYSTGMCTRPSETRPETHVSETKMRPRRSKFCSRRDVAASKTLAKTLKLPRLFENSKGVTPNESAKWKGGGQNLRFLANKSLYLSNGAR